MFAVGAVAGKKKYNNYMPFSLRNFNKRQRFVRHYPSINAMKSVATGPLEKTNIVLLITRAVSTMPVRNEYVKDFFYEVRRFADVGIFLYCYKNLQEIFFASMVFSNW